LHVTKYDYVLFLVVAIYITISDWWRKLISRLWRIKSAVSAYSNCT